MIESAHRWGNLAFSFSNAGPIKGRARYNALMEELADFFRKAGRTHLAKAIGLQTRTINLTIQALDKKVEAMTPEALLDQAVKTDPSAVAPAKADGSSSTSSPASSESTPAP